MGRHTIARAAVLLTGPAVTTSPPQRPTALRRALFIDGGDIVLVDSANGTRRQRTRTKGALLICHGMVDTNVHVQDSVRLVQRLSELQKENWTIAPYPVENHAFTEAASWADEYKRILQLCEANLRTPRNGKAT